MLRKNTILLPTNIPRDLRSSLRKRPVRRSMRMPLRRRKRGRPPKTLRRILITMLRRTLPTITQIRRTLKHRQELLARKLLIRIRMEKLVIQGSRPRKPLSNLANELFLASSPVQISRFPITLSRLSALENLLLRDFQPNPQSPVRS